MRCSYMDKKSFTAFVIVVAIFSAVAICPRNDPFQVQYLRNRELGFFKDHLINATNTATDHDTTSSDCSKESVYVSQGQTTPLPEGIPTYTVQIQNICMPIIMTAGGSCSIYDIHLSCGWFSSARLINPNVFKRISFDDCLVNNGDPISPGQTISFQYANTYPYPMSVSSVSCY